MDYSTCWAISGVKRSREKSHLFSGNWGERKIDFRELGSKKQIIFGVNEQESYENI